MTRSCCTCPTSWRTWMVSDWTASGPMAGADPTPPAFSSAPTNLTVTAVSENQIDLTWTDTSSDETGFLIEMSVDGSRFREIARTGAFSGTGTVAYSFTEALSNTRQYFYVA